MKFYMIFHIPSGGFFKTFIGTFDECIFTGITQGMRFEKTGVTKLMESLIANEKNGVNAEDLKVYEFIGKAVDNNKSSSKIEA